MNMSIINLKDKCPSKRNTMNKVNIFYQVYLYYVVDHDSGGYWSWTMIHLQKDSLIYILSLLTYSTINNFSNSIAIAAQILLSFVYQT